MSGTSLQLQPSSTLHFSASFYMDFWLAVIYIQICLRSTPFYRTMEDLSYISIYDYIYIPFGGEQTKDEHIWTYDETCISSISMCTTYACTTYTHM